MKIALIINKIDTNGGIQKNYRLLFELFKSYGHEVYLFVMFRPELVNVEETNIIFLDGDSLKEKGNSLQKEIKTKGIFDLVIANAAQLKKYIQNENYYLTTHNTWSIKLKNRSFFKRWKRYRRIKKELANERVIGISKGVIDDLNNVLGIKTKSSQTIYAPHNFDLVKELANEPIDVQGEFILGLGGLQKRKRFDLLIQSYKTVLNTYPELKLVIVGNGEEENNLQNLIKKLDLEGKVILTGFRENPYPYIKNAKLLVSCSTEEGLPRVLVEALVLNTPAVSTESSSSVVEILSNELEEFICEVDNQKALEELILKALNEYPKIEEKYYEKFNQHTIYNQYIKLAK